MYYRFQLEAPKGMELPKLNPDTIPDKVLKALEPNSRFDFWDSVITPCYRYFSRVRAVEIEANETRTIFLEIITRTSKQNLVNAHDEARA